MQDYKDIIAEILIESEKAEEDQVNYLTLKNGLFSLKEGKWIYTLEKAETIPYSDEWKNRLSELENRSAIEFAKPDIVIFIIGETEKSIKPSAQKLSSQADIIIVPDAAWTVRLVSMTSAKIHAVKDYPYVFDDEAIQVIISFMEEIVKKKEIERMLKERAIDARITCTAARMIAEELSVSYSEVGNAANELKIKIKNCELGCF